MLKTSAETAFTTFWPRYFIENEDELAQYYETEPVTKCDNVKTFFQHALTLGIDVAIGYGEDAGDRRYNTAVYVSGKDGNVLNKYRKIHIPGTVEPFDRDPNTTNQLEKRYFTPGDLGFNAFKATSLDAEPIVGQLICNDRRWAEGWRAYGLQGAEIVCCGYVSLLAVYRLPSQNTTAYAPQLWGGDQNITREKAYAEAMVGSKFKLGLTRSSTTS